MIGTFHSTQRTLSGRGGEKKFGMWIDVDFRKYIRELPGAHLHVFLAIALHTNEDGWAFPSIDLLRQETGYNKGTISSALTRLCQKTIDGRRILLSIQQRKGGSFVQNYYLIFPSPEEVAQYETTNDIRRPRTPASPKPASPSTENPYTAPPSTEKPYTENRTVTCNHDKELTPSELASPIHAPCSAEEHTQAEQAQNNLELHEILEPQDVSGLSEDKQEPQTNTNSQPLVVSEREKAIVRRAAKIDQPSGEHLTADIAAKGTQQPRTARNTSDQYLDIGNAETGPQKPAQQADTPEAPAQHTFLPGSDLERSADPPKKPRRTRPASPATQYRKAVNRTLAELGFKVGNQGNPQEAITEAMELVGEDDLKPMLVWATQGWRSEWYRLEKIAEHAIAWKAREAQRKRTEIPRVEDMDLSMYDMTEEDYAAMRRAAAERQRQREEEKKNWWNTPASPPA